MSADSSSDLSSDSSLDLGSAYPGPPADYKARYMFGLNGAELIWVDHYFFLLQRGYQLRSRYKPGWQGSWLTNGKYMFDCEDCYQVFGNTLDATRISDNVRVLLRLVYTRTGEIPSIGLFFSSPAVRSNPKNHCVPVWDIIPLPTNDIFAFIVTPIVQRFYNPPFERRAECIEAIYQMLEGLEFMHERNVANRDACFYRFSMDPTKIVPGGFHCGNTYRDLCPDGVTPLSKYESRTAVGPIKYYWVGFQGAIRFSSFDEPRLVVRGDEAWAESTVPESSSHLPYDPFKADMFQVGMAIKHLCEGYEGLEFMQPLIASLIQIDPQLRPTASKAVLTLKQLTETLRDKKLVNITILTIPLLRPDTKWGMMMFNLKRYFQRFKNAIT